MRLAALCLSLIPMLSSVALAQSGPSSPQERRDQIAKVQEMLADPDPLLRLANMEAIVSSGDALKIMIATRTAFASDDADLRGLAMRAYLATHREITFDVLLPPAIRQQYDTATPGTLKDLNQQYSFLPALRQAAFRIHLKLTEYTLGQDNGKVASDNYTSEFTITGEKFSTRLLMTYFGVYCYIDFSSSRRQTLDGTLACEKDWPKLAISAPIF
jgi:hypothetical protein